MIHSIFWALVLSKYLLWIALPTDYFLAMAIWILLLSGFAFIKTLQSPKLIIFNHWTFHIYLLFFLWTAICCTFSPPEERLAAICYAFLPLFVWPFIPKTEYSATSIREFCWGISIASTVVVGLLAALFGLDSLSDRATGITQIGPNTIGFIAATGTLCSLHLLKTTHGFARRTVVTATLAFCFMGVVFSFSKTVMVGLFGAFLMSRLSLASTRSLLLWPLWLIALCSAGLILILALQDKIILYLENAHSFSTLSGRTLLWEQILSDMSGLQLLIGTGFNSSTLISGAAGQNVFGTDAFGQAHNSILEGLINTGFIGVFFLFGAALSTFFILLSRITLQPKRNVSLEERTVFSIFVVLLFRSVTEGSFAQPGTIDSVLLFFLIASSISSFRRKTGTQRSSNTQPHRTNQEKQCAKNPLHA